MQQPKGTVLRLEAVSDANARWEEHNSKQQLPVE
jgi:hypothetical protein